MSEKKPKKPPHRPSIYTEELAERICQVVETHPHGIRRLTKMYDWMPQESTIYEWRARHESFSERYMQARHRQTHVLFENAIDEIEDLNNYIYVEEKTKAMKIDPGIVAMKKAIASQKVRHAAQINPKDYDTRRTDEPMNPHETLSKIRDMVNDLNKTNSSEI